jgi:hypothetical protein
MGVAGGYTTGIAHRSTIPCHAADKTITPETARSPPVPGTHDMNSALRHVLATVVLLGSNWAAEAQPAFSAADVAWSRAAGTATVEGRAEVPNPGGLPQGCAGGEAQLFPADPYATSMMRFIFGSDARGYAPLATARYPDQIAADFRNTVRRIGCDAEGRFRFDAVPAGRWYVFTNVVFRSARGDAEPMGGSLMQRIDVADGARTNVLLTP